MSLGDTRPIKATSIREGNHVIVDGEVYKVQSTEKSKAGKHGHAKVRMSVEHITTGNKKSLVMPGDDKMKQPIIDKCVGQVLAVNPDSLQLMDKESFEVFEVALPDYEEIGGKLESGDEVDYWRVLGNKLVRRKRSLD